MRRKVGEIEREREAGRQKGGMEGERKVGFMKEYLRVPQ